MSTMIVLHCFLCIFSEKPREFLIEKLEQLKLSQQSGVIGPNLFDDSNLDVVFRIMDPDNKQYITFVQYKQGECWTTGTGRDTLNTWDGAEWDVKWRNQQWSTVALQPKDTGFKSSLGPFCDEFERPPLIVSLHRPQNYVANVFILYIAKCYCNNNNHSSPQLWQWWA